MCPQKRSLIIIVTTQNQIGFARAAAQMIFNADKSLVDFCNICHPYIRSGVHLCNIET